MRDKHWRESRENTEERIQRDESERKTTNTGEIRGISWDSWHRTTDQKTEPTPCLLAKEDIQNQVEMAGRDDRDIS